MSSAIRRLNRHMRDLGQDGRWCKLGGNGVIRLAMSLAVVWTLFVPQTGFGAGNADNVAPLVIGDTFTIAVTNNRAGSFQEWFERFFDMRAKGLLLPSDTSGSIADSLIG